MNWVYSTVRSAFNIVKFLCAAALAGIVLGFLSGCGAGTTSGAPALPPDPPVTAPVYTYAGTGFGGRAMAGGQPIAGASMQLYAAGTAGGGSTAASLLAVALTTDSNGGFTVGSNYDCPSASSELYILVRGGKVGNLTGNSAIALAAPIGACGKLRSSVTYVVNEVTTVATAWALAQFFGAGGSIGAAATNSLGLANAFATALNLADVTKGKSPGAAFPANGASPAARINSLANLLNTCTATLGASSCDSLFSAATPAGGTAPDNTLDAAVDIARNPGNNVSTLFAQASSATAFLPALAVAPSDWTLFVNYGGGGMSAPSGVGIDASGNVWVASYFSAVSEFSPVGSPIFPGGITSGGLLQSYGLAVDAENNIWIPDEGSSGINSSLGSVTVLSSAGQAVSGATGFSSGGLNYPVAIAIDPGGGDAWVVNYGNSSLTVLSSSGQALSGVKGYASGDLEFPVAVAIDAGHNAWVANNSGTMVTKVAADGAQVSDFACCNGAGGLAIDQRGNVWVANYFGDSISLLSNSGAVISSGYSDNKASIYHPQGIAVDGAGDVWVSNYLGGSITELSGTAGSSPGTILSPGRGYAKDASLLKAFALAIDASGNVWVTNFGSDTLTEIVGIASPVKTPQLGPAQSP